MLLPVVLTTEEPSGRSFRVCQRNHTDKPTVPTIQFADSQARRPKHTENNPHHLQTSVRTHSRTASMEVDKEISTAETTQYNLQLPPAALQPQVDDDLKSRQGSRNTREQKEPDCMALDPQDISATKLIASSAVAAVRLSTSDKECCKIQTNDPAKESFSEIATFEEVEIEEEVSPEIEAADNRRLNVSTSCIPNINVTGTHRNCQDTHNCDKHATSFNKCKENRHGGSRQSHRSCQGTYKSRAEVSKDTKVPNSNFHLTQRA